MKTFLIASPSQSLLPKLVSKRSTLLRAYFQDINLSFVDHRFFCSFIYGRLDILPSAKKIAQLDKNGEAATK
jgi:hypothetical protein